MASPDGGVPPYTVYDWTFDGVKPKIQKKEKPEVVFAGNTSDKPYTVKVDVTDSAGKKGNTSIEVTVPVVASVRAEDPSDVHNIEKDGMNYIVAVKGSGFIKLKANVLPDTSEARNMVVWSGAELDPDYPNDKSRARVSRESAVGKYVTAGISKSDPLPALARLAIVWVSFKKMYNTPDAQVPNTCDLLPFPLGAQSGESKNGIVMEWKIEPQEFEDYMDTIGVSFDIQRTVNGARWDRTSSGWSRKTANSNDDKGKDDEDLTPDEGLIYSSDSAGPLLSIPTPGVYEYVQMFNATEFVNLQFSQEGTGIRCSSDFLWHSIVWLDVIDGSFHRKTSEKNEIDSTHITIPTNDNPRD